MFLSYLSIYFLVEDRSLSLFIAKVWPFFGLLSVPHVFSVFLPSCLFKTLKIPLSLEICSFSNIFSYLALWSLILHMYKLVFNQRLRSLEFLKLFLCAVPSFRYSDSQIFAALTFLNTNFSFFNSEKLLSLGFLSPHYSLQTAPR